MSARVLIIALDGADGALLDRWSADGTLPNLQALRNRGAVARLTAPEGVTDDALWASFKYASGLGEHGRYHYRQRLRSGAMGMAFRDEADRDAFWDDLSERGCRAAIFDVPKCGAPRPIDGIHLVDWLVHGRYFKRPRSFPETLAADVLERFGEPPPSMCGYDIPALSDEQVLGVTANLRASAGQKLAAGLHYLGTEAWDLFIIAFKEAHCGGHHLWDLADPRHVDHDPERTERLGHPMKAILKDLDAAAGALIEGAGKGARVLVFSTTDMEPTASLAHLMPTIVQRISRHLGDGAFAPLIRKIRRRLDLPTAGPACELMPYNHNSTALRVNLQIGPFRRPSEDTELRQEMTAEIERLLRELRAGDTGEPVVEAIDRPSAEHAGERSRQLPDLLVRYREGTIPRAVVSERLGRIEAEPEPSRPGDHAAGGIVFSSESALDDVASIQDVGPWAANRLGL